MSSVSFEDLGSRPGIVPPEVEKADWSRRKKWGAGLGALLAVTGVTVYLTGGQSDGPKSTGQAPGVSAPFEQGQENRRLVVGDVHAQIAASPKLAEAAAKLLGTDVSVITQECQSNVPVNSWQTQGCYSSKDKTGNWSTTWFSPDGTRALEISIGPATDTETVLKPSLEMGLAERVWDGREIYVFRASGMGLVRLDNNTTMTVEAGPVIPSDHKPFAIGPSPYNPQDPKSAPAAQFAALVA